MFLLEAFLAWYFCFRVRTYLLVARADTFSFPLGLWFTAISQNFRAFITKDFRHDLGVHDQRQQLLFAFEGVFYVTQLLQALVLLTMLTSTQTPSVPTKHPCANHVNVHACMHASLEAS